MLIEYIIVCIGFSIATYFTLLIPAFQEAQKKLMSFFQHIGAIIGWIPIMSLFAPLFLLMYLMSGHKTVYKLLIKSFEESQ